MSFHNFKFLNKLKIVEKKLIDNYQKNPNHVQDTEVLFLNHFLLCNQPSHPQSNLSDMNNQSLNFNQFSRKCCKEFRHKSHIDSSTFPPFYISHTSESGICDGMNNCHLKAAECTANYSMNDIPILNPYVPTQLPVELQTTSDGVLKGTLYHQQNAFLNQEYVRHACCVNQFENIELENGFQPQQQFLQNGFLRFDDLGKLPLDISNDCVIEMNEERVNTSIKFQDRNKKLDFKTNFRDENRKSDGCFSRESDEISSPPKKAFLMTSVAPTPKKKWILHYLTGNFFLQG